MTTPSRDEIVKNQPDNAKEPQDSGAIDANPALSSQPSFSLTNDQMSPATSNSTVTQLRPPAQLSDVSINAAAQAQQAQTIQTLVENHRRQLQAAAMFMQLPLWHPAAMMGAMGLGIEYPRMPMPGLMLPGLAPQFGLPISASAPVCMASALSGPGPSQGYAIGSTKTTLSTSIAVASSAAPSQVTVVDDGLQTSTTTTAATTARTKGVKATGSKAKTGSSKGSKGRRRFQCDLCDRQFNNNGHLRVHRRTHTGERPYKCKAEGCNKAFAQNGDLVVHTRLHTGERPYACRYCDKAFAQSAHRLRHERMHTGEKPYACRYCSKRFGESAQVSRHERIHTGEKPFACEICHKKFSALSSLKNHRQSRHPDAAAAAASAAGKKRSSTSQ